MLLLVSSSPNLGLLPRRDLAYLEILRWLDGAACELALERRSRFDLAADEVLDEATEADSGEGENGDEA